MNRPKSTFWRYMVLGFTVAALLHLSPLTSCNKDDDVQPDPVDEPSTLDLEKANMTADSVESAFASADVKAIVSFMAEVAKERSEDDIRTADPAMLIQFSEDFKNRKVYGYGSQFIEYEFDWNGIPYTIDFFLQEDGTFKIIRL